MRYPNLFLAGAPKCGTTSLAYYLGQHSEVFVPVEKEPIFFGSDLTASGERLSRRGYCEHYRSWQAQKYGLDASPHYFYSFNAAREIAMAVPNASILIMLRNPIDAAYSQFHQLRFNGAETLETFEASLDAEPARAAARRPAPFGFSENLLYSRVFDFTSNIERFEAAFGKHRVYVSLLEDLKADPAAVTGQICERLGLDAREVQGFDFTVRNVAKQVRSRWLNTLANYPPAWVGTLAKPLASRDTRLRIRQFIGRRNARIAENPPMADETRARLARHFRPGIEALSRTLDRDLSHWLADV